MPRGVVFGVWAKEFSHAFHEVEFGFRVDDAGRLVSIRGEGDRPRDLDEVVLDPGPYFRGAIWEVALVSEDRKITAFAKVIPRPIIARDGPCVISLELVSHRGERFLASGIGFVPGDEVIIESRYSGRMHQKRRLVSPQGLLPPDVISHAASGSDQRASYSVRSRSCGVMIEYGWGTEAFQRG